MNGMIGLSSLSAAFLSEAWTSASAEVVIGVTVVAGGALLLREGARTLRTSSGDTFDRYRQARTVARGLDAA